MYQRQAILKLGQVRCFCEEDLYTARLRSFKSTEIERLFFGEIDRIGKHAVKWWSDFNYEDFKVSDEAFKGLLRYMSVQKLRTPKGLDYLKSLQKNSDKNFVLMAMQRFRDLHCSIWAETVWAIVDASASSARFIISDHPVTVYNRECFPSSRHCKYPADPAVWQSGTHTLFPLSPSKLLIMTNLSWVRNPYQKGYKNRPNPNPLRPARFFDMQAVQIGRVLSEVEVHQMNFIIKKRARRYIAAGQKEWLYPEDHIPSDHWRKLDDRYLLMPDPRAISFTQEMIAGFKDGGFVAFDEYGRRPGQQEYNDESRAEIEWKTFHAFQGEFARLFGPCRRGLAMELGRLDPKEDDPDFHNYHLEMERKYMPNNVKLCRDQRAKLI